MAKGWANSITDVGGISVGHWTDAKAATGCTVALCERGAVGGVDVRGSAPGTRETDLLRPGNLVERVHGIVLSGGSAFGLASADGVMRYLEERNVGFKTPHGVVPIVPAAVLYDLNVGDGKTRPGAREGYQACRVASDDPVIEGSVGAGTGATVGKALGPERRVKGGLGTASARLGRGLRVGALMAVNAYGDVIDPKTGRTIAGPRKARGRGFERTTDLLARGKAKRPLARGNTTIGVVATNATLTKEQANKLAQMAQSGVSRAIVPAHTMSDGDCLFALATCRSRQAVDLTALGAVAAEVVAQAIVRGVTEATSVGGVPAVRDLP